MLFNNIVVGVDFSASSLAAARWAARSLAPDAHITLVHVLRDVDAPHWLREHLTGLEQVHQDIKPSLQGGLRGLADLIDPKRVDVVITSGAPADALVRVAHERHADLMVIGQTRTRRGSARFGATTVHRVLARSELPLAVVTGKSTDSVENVLVAVDDAPSAPALITGAWHVAQHAEARLHALHVLSTELVNLIRALHPDDSSIDRDGTPAYQAELERADTLTRAWLASLIHDSGVITARAETHIGHGDAGQEIVSHANKMNADLVVVGRITTPGAEPGNDRTAGARLPVGSTTRFVTWASPCPALVLPGIPTFTEQPQHSTESNTTQLVRGQQSW